VQNSEVGTDRIDIIICEKGRGKALEY